MFFPRRRAATAPARRDRQGGGAAVEFALIMPIFLMVVFGMVDYGWFFYQRYALAVAVRDGIRNGLSGLSTTPSPGDALGIAKARALAVLLLSNTIPDPTNNVTFGGGYSGASPTKALTLSAQYTFVPLIGFAPLPKTPMNYSMTMLLELEN
jgi:Flp pilus assembly protein TadG